jgi:hypothetical protein
LVIIMRQCLRLFGEETVYGWSRARSVIVSMSV